MELKLNNGQKGIKVLILHDDNSENLWRFSKELEQ
jgi:hypothetical protein